jgi:hypothetical protein
MRGEFQKLVCPDARYILMSFWLCSPAIPDSRGSSSGGSICQQIGVLLEPKPETLIVILSHLSSTLHIAPFSIAGSRRSRVVTCVPNSTQPSRSRTRSRMEPNAHSEFRLLYQARVIIALSSSGVLAYLRCNSRVSICSQPARATHSPPPKSVLKQDRH